MSSSPPRTALNTPTRTPLQERTQSQTNERPSARPRSRKTDGGPPQVYATSPFPTKPQHVLLPNTMRRQRSQRDLALNLLRDNGFGPTPEVQSAPPVPRQPAVRLKKSVKTLRDMYEAQSDDSRPSTALSVSRSRPGSSSSKLRSFSSNEGLAGRYAWEQFKSLAADDTALLPSLPEHTSTLRQIQPQSSFAARSAALDEGTSSPNFRVIGGTSSPRNPQVSKFSSDSLEESSEPSGLAQSSSSSPNVMRFGHSSSVEELPSVDEISSPNFVKLGTSSPGRQILETAAVGDDLVSSFDDPSSSPNFVKLGTSSPARTIRGYDPTLAERPSSSSSDASRKRKREYDDEVSSLAAKTAAVGGPTFRSSPPEVFNATESQGSFRSSPPIAPDVRTKSVFLDSPDAASLLNAIQAGDYEYEQDSSSVAGAHSELQTALSSSPAPPIQYPVVRAPASSQVVGLNVHKRHNRSSITADTVTPRWPSRLSAVPSEQSGSFRNNSKRSSASVWEDTDEELDSDDIAPGHFRSDDDANASHIRIVPASERHDEADDEVMGLPGESYRYRVNQLMRTTSYGHSPSSSQSRLNSMQSSVEHRLNSLSSRRPSLRRPSSSSSLASAVVPTWAKRYYSGLYQDSFKYLMASSSMVNVTQVVPPAQTQQKVPVRPESLLTTTSVNTPKSRRSFASVRESIKEKLPAIMRPRNRPRLEARKSHTMPGIGPLVSHPVRGPATAAMLSSRGSLVSLRQKASMASLRQVRALSMPLHPADPRFHWAGFDEKQFGGNMNDPNRPSGMAYYVPPQRLRRLPSISPHLHHDHRLNTGSTTSRGYGHPFNRRSRYSNPSDMFLDAPGTTEGKTRRSWHTICFILGFVFPPAWVVGAFLPLPSRPDAFADIEKGHWQRVSIHGHVTDREAMSVLTQLRQEKRLRGGEELHWQNARWWRSLNRWMAVVGIIVVVVVIVLAVIGTTRGL
jgi:hypothetical protein